MAGLLGQLANLQIRQQAVLASSAERQRTQYLGVPAPRGRILDRSGTVLASHRPSNVVLVHYPHYKDPRQLQVLAQILDIPFATLQKKAEYKLYQDGRLWDPLVVKVDITPQQLAAIVERKAELPGVEIAVQPVRVYPQGSLAAHVLGYVGSISEDELKELAPKGYKGDDIVGKAGLEKFYEQELRGQEGTRKVQVNYSFAPVDDPGWVREPRPGNNLVLTLDARLQRAAERALDWQLLRLQNLIHPLDGRAYPNAKAGAVVVMDVRTGAILAMASRPAFDPNVFITGSDKQISELFTQDPPALWNRAVSAPYVPGSTWKMLTAAAALASGKIGPDDTVLCTGKDPYTGQADWAKWGHGPVNVATALRDSCDLYFYELGRRLGIEALVTWAQNFGFGQRTGIDLPEEGKGFLPDAAYREKHGWWLDDTQSAAIGQIFQVTPLQLARYTAALANGGKLLRPYLVAAITDPEGRVIRKTEPQVVGTVPVPQGALQAIERGMLLVNRPGGTADFAIFPLPGIEVAGKTGTAENPPQDDYGVYVAFAPASKPEVAVAVVIEQAGHGSSVSPVARTVLAEYFGVPLPAHDPARVPAEFPEKAGDILKSLQAGRIWGGRGDR